MHVTPALIAIAALIPLRIQASAYLLPDDILTRGDWVGTYGSYAHVGPWVHHGGAGWPVKYHLYVKHLKDRVRYWFASYQPQLDRAVPFNAVLQRRTMAAFDDHGEVYPLGTGPNLYVDLTVPQGRFLLSLYFYEVDWVQYRAYRVTVRESAPVAGRGRAARDPVGTWRAGRSPISWGGSIRGSWSRGRGRLRSP